MAASVLADNPAENPWRESKKENLALLINTERGQPRNMVTRPGTAQPVPMRRLTTINSPLTVVTHCKLQAGDNVCNSR